MISAADFDDVFGWSPWPVCATMSGERELDAAGAPDLRTVPVGSASLDVWTEALPGEVSHPQAPLPAVETRSRDLAGATV
jgi:hypothetical protein